MSSIWHKLQVDACLPVGLPIRHMATAAHSYTTDTSPKTTWRLWAAALAGAISGSQCGQLAWALSRARCTILRVTGWHDQS